MEWKWSPKQRVFVIAGLSAFGVFLLASLGMMIALDWYFSQRVFPNTRYGTIDLGGLTRSEAGAVLEQWREQWWSKQLVFIANDETGKELATVRLLPVVVDEANSQSYDMVWYDLDTMLSRAFEKGRFDSPIQRMAALAHAFASETLLTPKVEINREKLQDFLKKRLYDFETQPQEAGLANRSSFARPQVVAEQAGNTFDYAAALNELERSLVALQSQPIVLARAHRQPVVTSADVAKALESYNAFVAQFPLTISYDDPEAGFVRRWDVYWPTVFNALIVVEDLSAQPHLTLDASKLETLWAPIEVAVNAEAENAKFEIGEDKKVKQFQPSKRGVAVDREQTFASVEAILQARVAAAIGEKDTPEKTPVMLVVRTVDPTITTENVNDLGITEVLGVGYSNYSGSPKNRVHNIGVGVRKLNGTLIPPDQEFSLLSALRPFTELAGYLPELVIKGDKIEPEVGGGLCQIGSTTFRAAMNAGLPIVERRNHSLVVSYYNDPRNHNPGTDATIYDPAPDLKFKNDTGHFILITTSMNYDNGDLTFTLWGTSDGRKGEYTEPVVSRWIPVGEEKLIESPDLAPGQKKCQSAHIGAVTTFTYTITKPDGTKTEVEFPSTYRPLPKICLVGVDPNALAGELPVADVPDGIAPDGTPIDFSG